MVVFGRKTILQVFEPAIYSKLSDYKDMLCGMVSGYSYERQKSEEDKIQNAINVLVKDSDITENIKAAKK